MTYTYHKSGHWNIQRHCPAFVVWFVSIQYKAENDSTVNQCLSYGFLTRKSLLDQKWDQSFQVLSFQFVLLNNICLRFEINSACKGAHIINYSRNPSSNTRRVFCPRFSLHFQPFSHLKISYRTVL